MSGCSGSIVIVSHTRYVIIVVEVVVVKDVVRGMVLVIVKW